MADNTESEKIDKEEIEKLKREIIFKPLNSAEELRDWMYLYFDIWFPMGVVYPTSTHGPIESMWRIYELFQTGETKSVPQVVMVASRDSYKTLSAAAIEVLLFVHFRMPMAHAAAIKFQAGACVSYANTMFRKIRPYLEYHGWTRTSDNKTLIEWRTDKEEDISLTVLTATKEGFNSRHCPLLVLDELDLMDAGAFQESRMVPSMYKGISPLVLILSTRKFAAGLMESEIARTPKIGGEVFRWNILDVAERVSFETAEVDKPKVIKYITHTLPMSNITPEEWGKLAEKEQIKYERFEAYAGIADHPMLPVMRHYLVNRPQTDCKFLYKPLTAVHNNFKITSIEIADAQLLCNKPSSAGLVYPRFDIGANTLTLQQAWKIAVGSENPTVTHEQLREFLIKMGCIFIGGADWGFTDYTSLIILCILPGGNIWVVDHYIDVSMETEDVVKIGVELQNKWGVDKWWVDQNRPDTVASLRKKGLKIPDFTKVVAEGIGALQSRIVDSNSVRKFFVLAIPENKMVIEMFGQYKWTLDSKGEIVEGKPYHDREGYSDVADSLRYPMQNLFSKTNKVLFTSTHEDTKKPVHGTDLQKLGHEANTQLMMDRIGSLIPEDERIARKAAKKPKSGKKILFM